MSRLTWGCAAVVVAGMMAITSAPVAAQGTACDSPCKLIPLPLIGQPGAVCEAPCKLTLLPLVTHPAVVSQVKLPFKVDTISADSMRRVKVVPLYSEVQVDKPATLALGSPQPIYPDSLRIKRVEGEFLAAFIVDTMGRVDLASFRILKLGHPLFIASVRDALPMMRFIPAELNGVKVRQLFQKPFVFSLDP